MTNKLRFSNRAHWAEQQGAARAIDGLGMLVEQAAAESFCLWRGVMPETGQVLSALRRYLKEKNSRWDRQIASPISLAESWTGLGEVVASVLLVLFVGVFITACARVTNARPRRSGPESHRATSGC